jgi:hypothetical protein
MPSVDDTLFLSLLFFAVATIYSTVGHAGASGYLAAMALLGLAPEVMRPTALTLNIVVAAFTAYRFRRARFFSWSGLWPFLLGSVPFAALGGAQKLSPGGYYAAVGVVLLVSALYLTWRAINVAQLPADGEVNVRKLPAVFIGAVIGLLSGLTGTGGGIFLSPTILFLGWAGPKSTAGISAPFILVNSIVALAAGAGMVDSLPINLPIFAASAIGGALLGTWLGLERLRQRYLLVTLAVVMAIAAFKLLLIA